MMARNPSRKDWLHGVSWVPIRQELLQHPAWRRRPIALARILERLEIEHMRHAGKENGALFVTFDQFVAFGISRKFVHPMLKLGEALGLLQVIQTDNWIGDVRPPNAYRLCYLPEKGKKAPTDEWSFLDEDGVLARLAAHKATTTRRNEAPAEIEAMESA